MILALILIILSVLLALHLFVKKRQNFWRDNGIPQDQPKSILGNLTQTNENENIMISLSKYYHKVKNNGFPFYGMYFFYKPVALATNLDFIRTVMVKDFNNFMNRGVSKMNDDDILAGDLTRLESHEWKEMRSKLTPTFTSGKMKLMFPNVISVGGRLVDVLNETIKSDGVVEIKDLAARYTTDVIGNVAFGIECNSLEDPNNLFRQMGTKFFEKPKLTISQRIILSTFPGLAKMLNIHTNDKEITDFFVNLLKDTVDYREINKVRRNDFMDLLIQLKNGRSLDDGKKENSKPLDFKQIAPQAFVFFTAGFETSSTLITHMLYELAHHENYYIQDKVRNEINSVLSKQKGELSYEALNEMTYVDQVMNETLRKYPAGGVVTRVSERDYEYGDQKLKIPKGTRVLIPIYGIHHDPEYFPNPDEFDPNRFTSEEIEKRPSNTFMPFGDGPRNCVGIRFGKLQAKIGLVLLVKNFKFSICERTEPKPIKFNADGLVLFPAHGIWLNVKAIH